MTVRLMSAREADGHPSMDVYLDEDDKPMARVCADSWCRGECGLPALASHDGALRAFGPMVAIGKVMGLWRSEWLGKIVRLDEAHSTQAEELWWT